MFFQNLTLSTEFIPIKKQSTCPLFNEYIAAIEDLDLEAVQTFLEKREIRELEFGNDLQGLRLAIDNWHGDLENEKLVSLILDALYPNGRNNNFATAKQIMSCKGTYHYGQGDYHEHLDNIVASIDIRKMKRILSPI